ncbi:uncharacterized protein AB675_1151 [Cyphellophora attinorum]|uniref:Uncharacterized protein n=1 Tax=Cyphellophora attinorum TaxID=1664694 RepID=A0A0N0NKH6_9EURO|nr:uncharacterized protein AB675_1151 [Phialophora attinorum]KPI38048.1 hypothetical protein AB675_1151 [Phialophora attinorum]
MARKKLPWLADASTPSRPSIKRESPGITTPPRQRSIKDWQTTPRTPASRPRTPQRLSDAPQHAVTAPDPMREGFEADDIWMMVEDEFNEVAKAFSAHLHQAEYERRVKAAKEAPPKSPPLHARQAASLTQIGIEPEAIDAGGQDDDPWRGTHLAPLVSVGSRKKISLKGLDRLPSSSRAAQGFSRVTEQPTTKSAATATATASNRPEPESDRRRSVRELPAELVTNHVRSDKSSRDTSRAFPPVHINGNPLPKSSVAKKRSTTARSSFKAKKVKKEEVIKEDPLEMPMW